jgi:hypothetical protein
MTDKALDLETAPAQSARLGGLGEKTVYISITVDLTGQKAVGVKFCKGQGQLTAFQRMFNNDYGEGHVTFAHAYDAA